MSILEKILVEKEKEVAQLKKQTFEPINVPNNTSFKATVTASTSMNVIAEIKRSSPSKGAIQMNVDPVKQAIEYEELGAGAISVLTDKTFFNGSMDDLRAVRQAVNVPILCKDFIIDPIQIDQANANGANIILLIVAALPDASLKRLYEYAKSLNLEVLCEVHNEDEMIRAVELGAEIIGINNRNLKTFEVDIQTTEKLVSMINNPKTIVISESGIKSRDDVIRVAHAGAQSILVGETLMRSTNLDATFRELKIPLNVKGVR
ncbi:indole-3-glycerol phosphate synthase TrpC [Virgibacillus byunsanensis]|uniref:Indole-3-glycerol phosphate synthase n=1 Tax=Virgibacillus byunsanensis TaxID=570945 RepID=A0ABW3LJM9_9BACI